MSERLIAFVGPGIGFVRLLVFAALGVGGCTTVRVDDLRFEQLRLVSTEDRAALTLSLRRYINNEGYPDRDIIEATLSASTDLPAVMQRDDAWWLTARVRKCGRDRGDGGVFGWSMVYYERREVAPLNLMTYMNDVVVARPEDVIARDGRYAYTIYFRVRDEARPHWPQEAYDLSATPFDVCVDVGAKAFAGAINVESNIGTIPALAFEALFAKR